MRPLPVTAATLLAAASAAAQWGFVNVSGPPAAYEMAMCYDMARGHCVLLLGSPSPATWTYDGSWHQLSPAHNAPGRRFAVLVHDPWRGVDVVYGGRGGGAGSGLAADETWEWNGTDWTQVAPLTTPGGLESYAATYDLGRQRLVLYGGMANSWVPRAQATTWEYDGTQWTTVTTASNPGNLERATACFHLGLNATVLFGGRDPSSGIATDDTWTYDGTDWRLVTVTGPRPQPRVAANMVYDAVRGRCVLFGGIDPATSAVLDDTWAFDGAVWRQLTGPTAGIHPGRAEGAMAMDVARNRIVHYGGRTQATAVLDETWEYGASFRTFGNGCAGSNGVPGLRSAQQPQIGSRFQIDLVNLPANPVVLMTVGLSNTAWSFGTLPALLTSFGMPNCRAYASAELVQPLTAANGRAAWVWQVPANAALVGGTFYLQGLALDGGVNAAGLTVSNAGAAVIGW